MGKLYTIDGKLLTDTPELRIGDKVYPVDNRTSTVKKMTELGGNDEEILKLAYGAKAAKEILAMNLPFPAYLTLIKTTVAAMTGEEETSVNDRFQKGIGQK